VATNRNSLMTSNGLVGLSGIYLDDNLRAIRLVASDGREVIVDKQAVRDWFRDTRPKPSIRDIDSWAGPLLTSSWNTLPGVSPISVYWYTISVDPLIYRVLVTAPGVTISVNWGLEELDRSQGRS
jgi:hypothetical protein